MVAMGVILIVWGWIMFVYGMWLYENSTLLSEQDPFIHQYIGVRGMEKSFYRLSYAIMIEGSICYLLPFFYQ